MDKIYVLEDTLGSYDDRDEIIVGYFSTREKAEEVRKEILEKADRTMWPWCYLDVDETYDMKLNLKINEYPFDKRLINLE